MNETRKIAAILVADVVGFSRLAGADEDGTLANLRALRRDLTDPTVASHHGRLVKRTGDGFIVEFRSVVDAVRCAIEIQNGMVMASMSRRGSRASPIRAGFAFRTTLIVRFATRSKSISPIWARRRSRTSPGQCVSIP
jgi:adenylate cyclase